MRGKVWAGLMEILRLLKGRGRSVGEAKFNLHLNRVFTWTRELHWCNISTGKSIQVHLISILCDTRALIRT